MDKIVVSFAREQKDIFSHLWILKLPPHQIFQKVKLIIPQALSACCSWKISLQHAQIPIFSQDSPASQPQVSLNPDLAWENRRRFHTLLAPCPGLCPPRLSEAPVTACFSCCSLHPYFCQVHQLRPIKQIWLKAIIFSRITHMPPHLVSQHSWLFWELSSGHSQCQVQQFISGTLYWKPFTKCSWYTSGMHFPGWEWPCLQMWPGQQCRLQTQNNEWLKLEKYSCVSTAQQYLP